MGKKLVAGLVSFISIVLMLIVSGCASPEIEGSKPSGGSKPDPFADTKAPGFVKSVIDETTILGRSFTIVVSADESSTLYYAVFDQAATDKTAQVIVAGTDAVVFGKDDLEANTEKNILISSDLLTPGTAYTVFITVADKTQNYTVPVKLTVTLLSSIDAVAPVVNNQKTSKVTLDGFTVEATLDKKGTIYYVVVAKGSLAPTSTEVKAGVVYREVVIVKSGKSEAGVTELTAAVSGLTLKTLYDVYITAENTENPPALMETAVLLSVTTLAEDDQAWTTDKLPKIDSSSDVTGTTVKLNVAVIREGTIYGVVTPKADASPTSLQIKEGKNVAGDVVSTGFAKNYTIGSSHKNVYKFLSFTGLTPSTAYSVHVTADNTSDSLIKEPYRIDFTTAAPDTTAPAWKTGFPKADTITANTCKLYMAQNKTGFIYYIVVPKTATAPTTEQIKAQVNYGGVVFVAKGNKEVKTVDYEYTQTISALAASTEYIAYFAGETSSTILMSTAVSVAVTTLPPDTTPQSWPADKQPAIDDANSTDVKVRVNLAVTAKGTLYGVLVPKDSTAPTTAQIKAGQDGSGTALAATFAKNYSITTDANLNIYKYIEFTVLTEGTPYDVYVTASNEAGVCIEPAVKLSVTTKVIALEWKATYPMIGTVDTTKIQVKVAQTKTGTIYYVIVPDGSATPTPAEVKGQIDYSSVTLIQKGTKTINTANQEYTETFSTGLTADTNYAVYFVGESSAGVLMATVTKLDVKTLSVIPAFSSIAPANAATNVSLTAKIVVTYTQNLKEDVKGTITFNGSAVAVANITVSGKTVTIDSGTLAASTTFTGISISGLKAVNGTDDVVAYSEAYSFTTGDGSAPTTKLAFANADMEAEMHNTTGESVDGFPVKTLKPTGTAYVDVIGRSGSTTKVLHVNGTNTSTGFIFTSGTKLASKDSYTKISFWIKGSITVADKALSIQIGSAGSSAPGQLFPCGAIGASDKTVTSSSSHSYTGSVNTGGNWVKISLDLVTGTPTVTDNNTISFKVGGTTDLTCDFYIDDIMYE